MFTRLSCFGACLGALVSIFAWAETPEFPVFFTEKAQIAVDGKADDWPVTLPCFLESDSQIRSGGRKTPQEFAVEAHLFFDAQNAYIFADVTDATPLNNPFTGNDIYKGDSLEVYFGFHREDEAATFGAEDAQFGLGLAEQAQPTWMWTKGQELAGQEIAVARTERGYAVEARIPLANFTQTPLKSGEPLWFDFGSNNNSGDADRTAQLIWQGDGTGWQSPKVWQKGRLFDAPDALNAARILTPPQFFTDAAQRVHVWVDGQPWHGTVMVGEQTMTTDEQGGITVIPTQKGQQSISADVNGASVTTRIEVESKKREKIIKLPVNPLKVNQWGYLPNESKRLVLTVEDAAPLASSVFRVTQNDKTVFEGKLEGQIKDETTGDTVYSGDFSALTAPGKYKIEVDGFGKSYNFAIGEDVHATLFYTVTRSYFLQRCGVAIHDSISKVHHPICHVNDGVMRQNEQETRDVTGGWHDAGDYGKYMSTAGVTVAQLLLLYESNPAKFAKFALNIPESGGALPDFLAEIKFELDWMLKMQDSDGGVFHKINTMNFPGGVLPSDDTQTRYIYEKGTSDTAVFVGGAAVAARVFAAVDAEYAGKLKEAAIRSGAFLLNGLNKEVLWPTNDSTGAYKTSAIEDDLFWAFAELYRLTGEPQYLDAAAPLLEQLKTAYAEALPTFSWDNTAALGFYTLLNAEKTPQAMKTALRAFLLQDAQRAAAQIFKSGYRMSLGIGDFIWASNKTACARGMQLIWAYQSLERDENFLLAARTQLDYVLGVNALSKSFVTGIGSDRARYPHHRILEASGVVVPGLLVGGPNNNAEDGAYKQGLQARGYVDDAKSYASNEYAIDYNAPLVFLAGYFMK